MKTCCVIGGSGFIGYHVVRVLNAKGRRVLILDKRFISPDVFQGDVQSIVGDYGDRELLSNILKDIREVILLAYSTTPKTSFENPIQDILENLPSVVSFFDVASGFDIDRIVLVSSGGTVYGEAKKLPIGEDHPTNPISPYGITKLTTEKYALMFREAKGLPVICVRPGNAYGEGQKPFSGQGFISTAIASVLTEQEVVVFGEKGTIRDYVHVSDIANGIVSVLLNGKNGSVYNIGTGVGMSTFDVLSSLYPFANRIGLRQKVRILPRRPYDVAANVLDPSKIIVETGWKPVVPFEEGINRTWTWMMNRYAGK